MTINLWAPYWGVECILAVIGTGGPVLIGEEGDFAAGRVLSTGAYSVLCPPPSKLDSEGGGEGGLEGVYEALEVDDEADLEAALNRRDLWDPLSSVSPINAAVDVHYTEMVAGEKFQQLRQVTKF
eukprot:1179517-Prorocentrum_minimum.AAC.1